ncbi:putative reverse transcriptase domain-containing protein [Tanacetum coccineum]
MSSPNHSTSDIEDAFSSMNIFNYTSVSLDYFPASSGSNSFNSSDNMIPPVFLPFYNNTWFSKIAKPMTKLTQKKVKFEWGDKQEAAFQMLKQKLCSAPILALPEGSEDFIAYCDASKKGLGTMLMQREKQ